MEETLNILKDISKSFEQFAGTLENATKQINKIHNLVNEKIGILSKDTRDMVEFIKKEDEKSNKLIRDLAENSINEIKRFYEYFELEKIKKMIKDIDAEISTPEIKKAASEDDLKSTLAELKEIAKIIKERK